MFFSNVRLNACAIRNHRGIIYIYIYIYIYIFINTKIQLILLDVVYFQSIE